MAKRNGATGLLSGKISLNSAMVATTWKGIEVLRQLAKNPHNFKTASQMEIRIAETTLANRWSSVFTAEQKALWDNYASVNSSLQAYQNSFGTSVAIIPSRGKIFSGFNAYISLNLVAVSAGFATKDEPPLTDPIPPPPSGLTEVWVVTPPGITIGWTVPVMPGTPVESGIRIWAKSFGKAKIHAQLVATVAVTATSYDLLSLKGGGSITPASITIATLPGELIGIQMDTVARYHADRTIVVGPASEVVTAKTEG